MIITVDIGNTNIVIGGFRGDDIAFKSRISTDSKKTEDEYAVIIRNTISMYNIDAAEISGAVISSVVPPLTTTMKKAIMLSFGVSSITVGPGVKTGIKIVCDSPAEVGADLICASVAAHEIYNEATVVIDLGTATKFIILTEDGSYIGLSIAPGVQMGINALSSGTAQLPQVGLEAPKSVIGKNTSDCIKSGVILGHASMIDGMLDRITEELGENWRFAATGGLAESIIPNCRHKIEIDEDLLLKGLKFIYDKNNSVRGKI